MARANSRAPDYSLETRQPQALVDLCILGRCGARSGRDGRRQQAGECGRRFLDASSWLHSSYFHFESDSRHWAGSRQTTCTAL